MTPSTHKLRLVLTTPSGRLPADLIDGITDAVISPPDPLARGEVIHRLVAEIAESVGWLHPDPSDNELLSLRRLVQEAQAHVARMAAAEAESATGWSSDELA